MRKLSRRLCLVLACLGLAVLPAAAETAGGRTVRDAAEVLTAMADAPEADLLGELLGEVQAVAVIPHARRLGFIVGVQSGTGVMVARAADGSWGSPLLVKLSGASVGWQAGIQSTDLLLFFRTKKSVDAILDGAFTMGVDVSIAAGSLGRQAGAGTDADMRAEIYSYARARGLFAGLSLGGSTLSADSAATASYYGREVRPADILGGTRLREPASAAELRRALSTWKKVRET